MQYTVRFNASVGCAIFQRKAVGIRNGVPNDWDEKKEFISLLSKHNIDIYQYADDELENEFSLIDKIAEGTY